MNLLPLFEKTPKMILVISGLVALGVGDHLSTTGLALSIEQCHTNLHLSIGFWPINGCLGMRGGWRGWDYKGA